MFGIGAGWSSHSSRYWLTTSITGGCFLQNSAGFPSKDSFKIKRITEMLQFEPKTNLIGTTVLQRKWTKQLNLWQKKFTVHVFFTIYNISYNHQADRWPEMLPSNLNFSNLFKVLDKRDSKGSSATNKLSCIYV